jgi:hypothetical protein
MDKLYIVTWILNSKPDSYATPNRDGALSVARAYDREGALVFWHEVDNAPAVVISVAMPRPPVFPTPGVVRKLLDISDDEAVDQLLNKVRQWGKPGAAKPLSNQGV